MGISLEGEFLGVATCKNCALYPLGTWYVVGNNCGVVLKPDNKQGAKRFK